MCVCSCEREAGRERVRVCVCVRERGRAGEGEKSIGPSPYTESAVRVPKNVLNSFYRCSVEMTHPGKHSGANFFLKCHAAGCGVQGPLSKRARP